MYTVSRGEKVSLGRLFQNHIVQREISDRFSEPRFLLVDLLPPFRLSCGPAVAWEHNRQIPATNIGTSDLFKARK